MHRLAVLACMLVFVVPLVSEERALPDLDTFQAQVKARLATDDARQSGYAYNERTVTEKVDGSERVTQRHEKVFEIYPGLPGDGPYRRLIEEDGRAVPPQRLADEDRKRQQAVESYAKSLLTDAGRRKDAERRQNQRREDEAAIDDIFRLYAIALVGRESVEGHDTIVATLTPRSNVVPLTSDGKVMRHFKAQAWISETDYEVVRVEIDALDDLSIGWGLFARIHKGAHATYLRRKVNDEIWLPAEVTWSGSARVFLLKQLRERGRSQFSAYRKFTVGTSTTFGAGGQ